MRAVVVSDLHVNAKTAGFERMGDVEEALTKAVDHAIVSRVDRFIMLGDLADPDSPSIIRSIVLAQKFAAILDVHGIPSVWVAGNHDVLEDGYGTTVLDPLRDMCTVVTQPGMVGDVLVFPYTPMVHHYTPEVILDAQEKAPKLILSHLMLEGISIGSESEEFARGRDLFLPIDKIRARWPDVLILNGHYHRRQTYRGIEIPGDLCRLTRAEANHEPCFLTVEY